MRKTIAVLFAILLSTVAHAQSPQASTTAAPCKKSSGINVFVVVDSRPTIFEYAAQKMHIAPAKSLVLVSHVEADLKAQGFCVFHHDEYDGEGKPSPPDVWAGTGPYMYLAFLEHVQLVTPVSQEFLVYSIHFGEAITEPALPFYILDQGTDTTALAREIVHAVQFIVKQ